MKRRNFLRLLPAAGVSSFAVNGFSARPFSNSRIANILASCDGAQDRSLVLIQLKGGNDGLNMIIPAANYDRYATLRPTTKINDSGTGAFIPIDNTLPTADQAGLHPAMTGLKDLYDRGWLSVVQSAGYQSMNQSHFKGTDLWLSGGGGSPDLNNLTSGWMGRALQAFYPHIEGVPVADMVDPLGIQIGDPTTSLGFHTDTEHQNVINLSGQDPSGFFSLIQTIGGAPIMNVPDSDHGVELEYIMGVERSINLYAQRITDVFNAGSNSITTYPTGTLAAQLKTVARMIKGGCKTKIFLCQLGGFDTHSAQVDSGDTSLGSHANLLGQLSSSIKTFLDDLEGMGLANNVMGCTFSEFGRCAKENGSFGTDHGTLSPMIVFGKDAKPGVFGTNPDLNNLTNDNQIKVMQFDYRQVFATLLQDWLGANPYVMEQTMFEGYNKMKLVARESRVDPDCQWGGAEIVVDQFRPMSVYPNPASISTEVSYENRGEAFDAYLSLHSLGGSLLATRSEIVHPGFNAYYFDVAALPEGIYFVRLQDKRNGKAEVMKLSVVRGGTVLGRS
jgi:uncharacterized protein (DUF1501 family)